MEAADVVAVVGGGGGGAAAEGGVTREHLVGVEARVRGVGGKGRGG